MYATEANHDQTSSQIFLYRIHPSAYLVKWNQHLSFLAGMVSILHNHKNLGYASFKKVLCWWMLFNK